MQEIAIFTLKLRTPRKLNLPPWLGRSVQAWYLDGLRRVHPEVSKAVHDSNGPKPYTVSTLLACQSGDMRDFVPSRDRESASVPDETYVRVTTLHHDVTSMTQMLVQRWLSEGITLHDHYFPVLSVDVQASSYAELLARAGESRQTPSRQSSRSIHCEFLSPTVFKKTGGLQVPLPAPSYVFGSLLQRWEQFSRVPLEEDGLEMTLAEYIDAKVEVRSHRVRTAKVSFDRSNRGNYTGFRGSVEFFATSKQHPHFEWLQALAKFAPFSGVGSHTTVGLGRMEVR